MDETSLANIDMSDFGNLSNVNQQPILDIDKLLGINQEYMNPSLAKPPVVTTPDTGFFKQGNSYMDNAGQALGLAGGVMSLADMLNNWGVAKDAMKTNMSNIRQQMDQSKTAFDRSVQRQDRSLAAVNAAEEEAKSIRQG